MRGTIDFSGSARKGSHRLAVFVEGTEDFAIPDEVVLALGLRAGMEVPDADLERLRRASERARAREAALRLLDARARSSRELVDRLIRKSFGREAAEHVVGELTETGLVDDREFARLWAEERMRLRPVGRLRLARELALKGVSREIIEDVLDASYAEHPETELARRVACARRSRGPVDGAARRRLYSLLLRRGFTHETVSQVLSEQEESSDV